jgi:hypothetical protein
VTVETPYAFSVLVAALVFFFVVAHEACVSGHTGDDGAGLHVPIMTGFAIAVGEWLVYESVEQLVVGRGMGIVAGGASGVRNFERRVSRFQWFALGIVAPRAQS